MVMTPMMMKYDVDSACVPEVGGGSNILTIGSGEADGDSPPSAYDDHITIVGHGAFREKNPFYIILLL